MHLTRLQLFEFVKSENLVNKVTTTDSKRRLIDYVLSKLPYCPEEIVTTKISFFCKKIFYRWKASGRNMKSFVKRNQEWLERKLMEENVCEVEHNLAATTTPTSHGRPKKIFTTLSTRSKQRLGKKLISSHSTEQLAFATQMGFVKKGQRNVANVIKKASTSSPRTLKFMKKKPLPSSIRTYTPDEALALIIDCKLTKDQYFQLRSGAKARNKY